MMEGWMEARGGEGLGVLIQDADGACTLAASKVFKGATKLRCLCTSGRTSGKSSAASWDFTNGFRKMHGRLSETGFEESVEELCEQFPAAEEYLRKISKDRRRWAAAFSVLAFSVSSFTSNRV